LIFLNEQAAIKLVYLSMEDASRKWIMRHKGCVIVYPQLISVLKTDGRTINGKERFAQKIPSPDLS